MNIYICIYSIYMTIYIYKNIIMSQRERETHTHTHMHVLAHSHSHTLIHTHARTHTHTHTHRGKGSQSDSWRGSGHIFGVNTTTWILIIKHCKSPVSTHRSLSVHAMCYTVWPYFIGYSQALYTAIYIYIQFVPSPKLLFSCFLFVLHTKIFSLATC